MRLILLVHRYLAVAVGVLMTLWCLSGFVMMYQAFPDVGSEQRLAGLAPLDFSACCDLGEPAPSGAVGSFGIEMLLGDPVLRGGGSRGGADGGRALNLRTGLPFPELGPEQALEVARQFAAGNGIGGTARLIGTVDIDQWTIQAARRNQPVYRVVFDDPGGNEVYVSGASGEVFQATDRRERVLAWLGVIPHWIYPTMLRQNGPVWTQIVIWTSVLGSFLAATGLYVGIARLRRRRKDNRLVSPFRGWWYWHHISGLVFGVLALTWVFSGLITMNPWGALAGGGGGNHVAAMRGTTSWGDLNAFLAQSVANADTLRGYRRLDSAPFDGRFYVVAHGDDDLRVRLDGGAGIVGDLSLTEVAAAARSLAVAPRALEQIEREDAYYYGHKNEVELPAFRLVLDDDDLTRLYVTPSSGAVRAVGSTRRLSRWIRTGLHDMDFSGLRIRPVWDVVVGLLLAGVTAVCATGTWLAFKRVKRDWRFVRTLAGRRFGQAPAAQRTRRSADQSVG